METATPSEPAQTEADESGSDDPLTLRPAIEGLMALHHGAQDLTAASSEATPTDPASPNGTLLVYATALPFAVPPPPPAWEKDCYYPLMGTGFEVEWGFILDQGRRRKGAKKGRKGQDEQGSPDDSSPASEWPEGSGDTTESEPSPNDSQPEDPELGLPMFAADCSSDDECPPLMDDSSDYGSESLEIWASSCPESSGGPASSDEETSDDDPPAATRMQEPPGVLEGSAGDDEDEWASPDHQSLTIPGLNLRPLRIVPPQLTQHIQWHCAGGQQLEAGCMEPPLSPTTHPPCCWRTAGTMIGGTTWNGSGIGMSQAHQHLHSRRDRAESSAPALPRKSETPGPAHC